MQVRSGMTVAMGPIFRSSRLIWAIGISLIVLTLLGCGVTVWDLHEQTIEQHRVAVRNLGIVLAEQTSRYVQIVDLVLQETQSRAASVDIRSPEELAQKIGIDATRQILLGRLKNLPQANAFFLLRADGRTLVTSRTQVTA